MRYDTFRLLLISFVLMAVYTAPRTARAQEESTIAGSFVSVVGEVVVDRNDESLQAIRGMKLHQGDIVRTGEDSAAGLVLRDDTTLSIGDRTELAIDDFEFEPAEGILGMALRVVQGTLACVAGRIAELSPSAMQVETPVGILGVRGTKFVVEVRP